MPKLMVSQPTLQLHLVHFTLGKRDFKLTFMISAVKTQATVYKTRDLHAFCRKNAQLSN